MNRLSRALVALLLAFTLAMGGLSACGSATGPAGGSSDASGDVPTIVCTTFPAYDWTRQVLGDEAQDFNLVYLLDDGVDLHSYQPTVEDIALISDCDLFVYVGGESDEWVEDALANATNADMRCVCMLEVIGDAAREEEIVEGMQEEHDHDHEHEGEEHAEEGGAHDEEDEEHDGEGLGPGQIGYLPQRDDSQRDFPVSVWEVALSGCLSQMGRRPFFGNRERTSASKNLERLGVAGLKDRPFGRLSGGQQQRVLIARALCAASRLLIMDESTTGLDPDAAGSLYATLDGLREEGMAIVAVVHDVGSALGHATHVLHVRAKGSDFHPTKAGRAGEGEKNDG